MEPVDQPNPTLVQLKSAKAARLPWIQIADALAKLELSGVSEPTGRSWLVRVSQETGYGTGQLRRMLRSRLFLRSLRAELTDDGIKSLHKVPVSSIEVLMRLYAVNPDLAVQRLRSYITHRGPTYRQLLRIYDEASFASKKKPDNLRLGIRQSKDFEDTCLYLIRDNVYQLSGDRNAKIVRPTRNSFEFTHPDFVLVQRSSDPREHTIVDAVEIRPATSHPKSTLMSRLYADVALTSSFFRWLWIMMPEQADVEEASTAFSRLCLDNVGILTVDTSDRPVYRVRRVPSGNPTPDRRAMIRL